MEPVPGGRFVTDLRMARIEFIVPLGEQLPSIPCQGFPKITGRLEQIEVDVHGLILNSPCSSW